MRQPGFTLVETLLFITLFALLVSSLLVIFPPQVGQLATATTALPATLLADGKLEAVLDDYYNTQRGMDYLVDGHYGEEVVLDAFRRRVSLTTVSLTDHRYRCTDIAAQAADGVKCLTVLVIAGDDGRVLARSRMLLWRP